jgi:hypothetical protein
MIRQKETVLDEIYSDFPERSRVWIYQASKAFTADQSAEIQETLNDFNANWDSHGRPITSKSVMLYDRFICFIIDDSPNKAGGCSIDTSVHLMKQFESTYGIELFNRLQVVGLATNGDLIHFDFKDTPKLLAEGKMNADSPIFNNTVSTLGAMKSDWMQALKDSWLKKYL